MPSAIAFVASEVRQKEIQTVAAEFRLPDIDGKNVSLTDFQGEIVVLDFWATWCEPCIAQIPKLNALNDEYAHRGVRVLGVVVESGSVKDIRQFLLKHKVGYPVLIGNDAVVNKYKVSVFPTTVVIDTRGRIHKKYVGERSVKQHDLENDIRTLIAAGGKVGTL